MRACTNRLAHCCMHDVQQQTDVPTELPFLVYLLSLNFAQTTTATTPATVRPQQPAEIADSIIGIITLYSIYSIYITLKIQLIIN